MRIGKSELPAAAALFFTAAFAALLWAWGVCGMDVRAADVAGAFPAGAEAEDGRAADVAVDDSTVAPVTMAMVTAQTASVYAGPAKAFGEIGELPAGAAVNVCGQTGDGWFQVVYGGGIGYVGDRLLTSVPVDDAMLAALASQAAYVKQLAAALANQATLAQQQAQAAVLAQQQAQAAALAQQQAQAAALAQQQIQAATLAGQQVQVAPAQPQEQAQGRQDSPPAGTGPVLFVGDSRTGQMGNAVGGTAAWPNVVFDACYGGGVSWLSLPETKKHLDAFVAPGTAVVFCYGVNDLSKHSEYIDTINRYSQEWMGKGASVFFASVGPVGENEFGKRNWAVEYFNRQLFDRLNGGIGRIDLYSYLTSTGYATLPDGIHYTPETYGRIFSFLMQSMGRL